MIYTELQTTDPQLFASTAKQLAHQFCCYLRTYLHPNQMVAVIARNAVETNPSICHSHDYCDPNQAMLDALAVIGSEYSDDVHSLIETAWDLAKKSCFTL